MLYSLFIQDMKNLLSMLYYGDTGGDGMPSPELLAHLEIGSFAKKIDQVSLPPTKSSSVLPKQEPDENGIEMLVDKGIDEKFSSEVLSYVKVEIDNDNPVEEKRDEIMDLGEVAELKDGEKACIVCLKVGLSLIGKMLDTHYPVGTHIQTAGSAL